jgi:hypothetical protein
MIHHDINQLRDDSDPTFTQGASMVIAILGGVIGGLGLGVALIPPAACSAWWLLVPLISLLQLALVIFISSRHDHALLENYQYHARRNFNALPLDLREGKEISFKEAKALSLNDANKITALTADLVYARNEYNAVQSDPAAAVVIENLQNKVDSLNSQTRELKRIMR